MPRDIRAAIQDLLAEYAGLIDEDRLEDWLDLFAEDCLYRIVARENFSRGLPLSLILCEGKGMLRDRHIVGAIRYKGEVDGLHHVESSYAVFQTSQEGESRLFSVGAYSDRIRETGGRLLFERKLVIADTGAIPTLLATPL
jgi:anthranilate 1,2-dioxygenase small subunit